MKTRAILQTSPFKTRDGEWRAAIKLLVQTLSIDTLRVALSEEHADLKPGDTITVERHGSEWRAV